MLQRTATSRFHPRGFAAPPSRGPHTQIYQQHHPPCRRYCPCPCRLFFGSTDYDTANSWWHLRVCFCCLLSAVCCQRLPPSFQFRAPRPLTSKARASRFWNVASTQKCTAATSIVNRHPDRSTSHPAIVRCHHRTGRDSLHMIHSLIELFRQLNIYIYLLLHRSRP